MILYHSPTSPYARKCLTILHLTGLVERTEIRVGSGTPLSDNPAVIAVNPLGKVPCLVTDDGRTIYDSRVICRYLDSVAGAGLYPEGAALWPVLTLEALADGILDAALLCRYEQTLRPEAQRFDAWIEGQMAKIRRGVEEMERSLVPGATPTAAEVAAGAVFGYLDFRFAALDWRASAPRLAGWYEGFKATPAMQASAPT